MEARNRIGIGLSNGAARLHSLAEFVPGNRFLLSLKVKRFGLRAVMGGGGLTTVLLSPTISADDFKNNG
jgi:hypothetical protein